ncbi:hypothetical protein KC19_2G263100 [Ceratodon purpureus]|uniref:Uncharacterized protein n=1 Tax=Ceratodon purpureus TaxID=3225 RepID=A0A8T0IZB9_CERPU|nr:hypothetical protein KC19_2G263100 [Ceratodon purpureus]
MSQYYYLYQRRVKVCILARFGGFVVEVGSVVIGYGTHPSSRSCNRNVIVQNIVRVNTIVSNVKRKEKRSQCRRVQTTLICSSPLRPSKLHVTPDYLHHINSHASWSI